MINYRQNNNVLFFIFAVLIIGCTLRFFPIEYIESNALADNPKGAKYYITLQTIITNYPQLSADHANAKYIKNRMMQFEKDVNQSSLPQNVTNSYKEHYYATLNKHGLQSISTVSDEGSILTIANASYANIDQFYLDKRLFAVNPLYRWNPNDTRRILNFNLGSLYYGLIPDKYARILFAVDSGIQLGAFPGFFVNNQTTGLGTQFMTGIPLLTALYVIPKYDFSILGSYSGMVPWCSYWSGSVTDKTVRKIINISGIDYFTLLKSEVAKRIKKREIKGIDGAIALNPHSPLFFDNALYQTYFNKESYGLAYLANQVNYVNTQDILSAENDIKHYFAKPDHHNPAKFMAATDIFYNKLLNLKHRHDIVIDSDKPMLMNDNINSQKTGTVTVRGIVGPRALFDSTCLRKNNCTFVVNITKASGWHAYVNNQREKINRANFAFMSVVVPHGQSTVWFIYESLPGLLSYLVSMCSLIFIFLYLGWNSKLSKRETRGNWAQN